MNIKQETERDGQPGKRMGTIRRRLPVVLFLVCHSDAFVETPF